MNSKREEAIRTAAIYHSAGINFFSGGKYKEARKNFENAASLDRQNSYYFNDLALSCAELGDMTAASKYYREALRINPGLSEARNGLATIMAIQGDMPGAIIEWEKVITDPLYKSPGIVHYNLGKAYLNLNDMGNAETHFQLALKFNPSHEKSLYSLGQINHKLGRIDEAVSFYRKAVENDQSFTPAHYYLGEILFIQKSYSDALKEFGKVIDAGDEPTLAAKAREYREKIKKTLAP